MPTPHFTVREMIAADAEAVAHVHLVSSRDSYRPLAREWTELDPARGVEQWTARAYEAQHDPQRVCLVAESDAAIIAFVSGGPPRRSEVGAEHEVYVIHVLPNHRGRGVGGALWSRACDSLRGEQLRPLYLDTLAQLDCCAFYEARGGLEVSREPGEFKGGSVTWLAYLWEQGWSHGRRERVEAPPGSS